MPRGVYIRTKSAWNKGKKLGFIPKEAFKKGHIPWNKGKECPYLIGNTNGFRKGQNLGNKHPNWKGGIKKTTQGYILIYQPNHPYTSKQRYVLRSRLVMEEHLGRYLEPKEIVHHKGIKYPINSIENRQDDRLENLMLFPSKDKHTQYHTKGK